jgi:hypothetical protein
MRKTIRAAQYLYLVPTGQTRLNRKTGKEEEVFSVRHAFHGDTVNIPRAEDIESGEAAGAFEPDEVEQASPVAVEQEPEATVATVVAAAGDDPDKAEALLAAEEEATGGQPRKGVESGLEVLMEEEE